MRKRPPRCGEAAFLQVPCFCPIFVGSRTVFLYRIRTKIHFTVVRIAGAFPSDSGTILRFVGEKTNGPPASGQAVRLSHLWRRADGYSLRKTIKPSAVGCAQNGILNSSSSIHSSANKTERIFSGMEANIIRTTVSAEVMLSVSTHSCVMPTAPMQ